MKSIGQLFLGLVTALASSLLVLSAASLSLLEGGGQITPQTPTTTLLANQAKLEISLPVVTTPTPIPMTPTPACPAPEGWITYVIGPGDTLESLAQEWGTTSDVLYKKNCLLSQSLAAGYTLYRPPKVTPSVTFTMEPSPEDTLSEETPTFTATHQLCGPPSSWIIYIVKPGDNLYRIGLAFGVTVDQLKFANCLTSDNIRAGQRLNVPNVPTRVPTITQTPTDEPPPATKTPQPTIEPTIPPTLPPIDVPTDIPTDVPDVPTDVPTESQSTEAYNNPLHPSYTGLIYYAS